MEEENEYVRGRRDPSGLFAVQIDRVCSRPWAGCPPPTQGKATLPPPVIPTLSLSESLPAMRMIPTPRSKVQSSDTPRTQGHTQTTTSATTSSQPAHDHDDDSDAQPPLAEPNPMPFLFSL
ncbi:hypothetical protein PIB30_103040, partial [Stylosanthes scabra]|nr:hypothetical protein [Stylosanthes scabra]